jgi:hypothetical protein
VCGIIEKIIAALFPPGHVVIDGLTAWWQFNEVLTRLRIYQHALSEYPCQRELKREIEGLFKGTVS